MFRSRSESSDRNPERIYGHLLPAVVPYVDELPRVVFVAQENLLARCWSEQQTDGAVRRRTFAAVSVSRDERHAPRFSAPSPYPAEAGPTLISDRRVYNGTHRFNVTCRLGHERREISSTEVHHIVAVVLAISCGIPRGRI